MTSELGDPVCEARDDSRESLGCNPLRERLAAAGLAVELAPVGNRRTDPAHRDVERAGRGDDRIADRFVQVHVLVRVDVRRRAPEEPLKRPELMLELLRNRMRSPRSTRSYSAAHVPSR